MEPPVPEQLAQELLDSIIRQPNPEANPQRTDFSVLIRAQHYYYNVQIVAINKNSGRQEAYATLTEAADEKRRKYSALGATFHPLIFSAGGLMEASTAKAYKGLQQLVGPTGAQWMDSSVAMVLTKTRMGSATSIAKDLPRRTA